MSRLMATPTGSERYQEVKQIGWLTAKILQRISAACGKGLANPPTHEKAPASAATDTRAGLSMGADRQAADTASQAAMQ